MAKKEKKAKKPRAKKNTGVFAEFKAFVSRGNVLDMAVGVIMGNAFGAIVTALVNILLSLATWAVPGGLKGLVTVLPALNDAQKGPVGGSFDASKLQAMTIKFAELSGVDVSNGGGFIETAADGSIKVLDTAGYASMQSALLSKYTLHGTTYTYNMAAVIDWGTFINAIISFIIIALVLFLVVKIVSGVKAKRAELEAKALEKYYQEHPEERPVPPEPVEPGPTELDILIEIRDALAAKKK